MKRYKMSGQFGADCYTTKMWSMEEDPNGEWVRYEDVKGLFQYKNQLRNLGVTLESESVECNCVEEATDRKKMELWPCADLSWICPAHGYKRL